MRKWDFRFMEMARLVGSWSKDTTQVGAVIVDPFNRVVSVGYNGPPAGVHDGWATREEKLARTIHAEQNALHFAHKDVQGCTIYITHPPCSHCAASLIQRGIQRVVSPQPDAAFIERWGDSVEHSIKMFLEANVEITYTEPHHD
jgi:dCMP deaminase